jgi:V-type H+-transporting ATPase subunit a
MGAFSMYTGIIYNDMFSISLNIFGSSWKIVDLDISDVTGNTELTLNPYNNFARLGATPYPVGMDPIWQVILIPALLEFLAAVLLKIQVFLCVNHVYQQMHIIGFLI